MSTETHAGLTPDEMEIARLSNMSPKEYRERRDEAAHKGLLMGKKPDYQWRAIKEWSVLYGEMFELSDRLHEAPPNERASLHKEMAIMSVYHEQLGKLIEAFDA